MRRIKVRPVLVPLALIGLALALSACAPGGNELRGVADPEGAVSGFWPGLWHGLIAPITFIISLFVDTINAYEVHNNGNWYNFGFVLGLSCSLGGGASGAAKRR